MAPKKKNTNNNQEATNFTKMLVIIAVVVISVALYFLFLIPNSAKPEAKGTGHTNTQQYADIGGEFVLTDHNGKEFSNKNLLGKPALIYFGFTFCPDICPASLTKMTEVMNILDKYKIDITPVFITIDPLRDNVDLLKEYMSNFHPKFVGLTGNAEDMKKVADPFKVYYGVADNSDKGHNDYLLNHTSFIYVMDQKGRYVKHFDREASLESIVEFIRINFR